MLSSLSLVLNRNQSTCILYSYFEFVGFCTQYIFLFVLRLLCASLELVSSSYATLPRMIDLPILALSALPGRHYMLVLSTMIYQVCASVCASLSRKLRNGALPFPVTLLTTVACEYVSGSVPQTHF